MSRSKKAVVQSKSKSKRTRSFDPAKHPRYPKGHPRGGKFMSAKDSATGMSSKLPNSKAGKITPFQRRDGDLKKTKLASLKKLANEKHGISKVKDGRKRSHWEEAIAGARKIDRDNARSAASAKSATAIAVAPTTLSKKSQLALPAGKAQLVLPPGRTPVPQKQPAALPLTKASTLEKLNAKTNGGSSFEKMVKNELTSKAQSVVSEKEAPKKSKLKLTSKTIAKLEKKQGAIVGKENAIREERAQFKKAKDRHSAAHERYEALAKHRDKKMLTGPELAQLGISDRHKDVPNFSKKNPIDDKMLSSARKERDEAKSELEKLSKGKSRTESFKTGRPLSTQQMNKPLTKEEQDRLGEIGNLPDIKELHHAARSGRRLTSGERDRLERGAAVHKAYQDAKKQIPELTPGEFAVMRNYTKGDGYILPNAASRGHMEDSNGESAKAGVAQARLIHAALGKLPDWKGEVRRDTRQSKQQFEQDYQVGKKITFHGVTSTTSDLTGKATAAYGDAGKKQASLEKQGYSRGIEASKASSYDQTAKKLGVKTLPQEDSVNVEYRMKVKTGKSISPLSVAPKEAEIALRHGWTGTIAKIEESNGKKIVYLEED